MFVHCALVSQVGSRDETSAYAMHLCILLFVMLIFRGYKTLVLWDIKGVVLCFIMYPDLHPQSNV